MSAPSATFGDGPTVTFPYGCDDPALIHVEFDVPTFDRDPGHIPNTFDGEYFGNDETLGAVIGDCLPIEGSELELQGPPGVIYTGALPPARDRDHWFGLGVIGLDLYVDGVFYWTFVSGATAAGAHVSVDVPTELGAPPVDWTVSHTFDVVVRFEDVPTWRYWDGWGRENVCRPIPDDATVTPYYPWAIDRSGYTTGYDPGGGIDWGPFGSDVPEFQLVHYVTFFPPSEQPVEETVGATIYSFTSPTSTATCVFTGFYDPAAGATVDDNAAPGVGGDPTHSGDVTLSTDWGCKDGTSFKFTGSDGTPAYLEFDPASPGDYDTWYYQSMLLYVPVGFSAGRFDIGETWQLMGIREIPSVGSPAWTDRITGVSLKMVARELSIVSFLGSPDLGSAIGYAEFGDPITISEGVPHCIRLAVKRNSDTSGSDPFHFWQYQVDETQSDVQQTRSLYNRPAFAVWGVLDNGGHAGFGTPSPSIYYGDDLRFDTTPLGCRCRVRAIKGWQRF